MLIEIELLTKCTLPSANSTLQPPGWKLLAFSNWPSEILYPVLSVRQALKGYCVELGGAIVLNRVQPGSPAAQR